MKFQFSNSKSKNTSRLYLTPSEKIDELNLSSEESAYLKLQFQDKKFSIINRFSHFDLFIKVEKTDGNNLALEATRNLGFEVYSFLKKKKIETLQLEKPTEEKEWVLSFLEGLELSSYEFNEYKKAETSFALQLYLPKDIFKTEKELKEIRNTNKAVFIARNLVNHPSNFLTTDKYIEIVKKELKSLPVEIEIFDKKQLKKDKFGGILAVNQGSKQSPYLLQLSYNIKKNSNPIVLVGKGIVYDTGGLSLKPTAGSMDIMKCDMAGSAAVFAALLAAVYNNVDKAIVVLIPLTDNHISNEAIAPGDVIKMFSGTTVEVMNTDAEGRLVLADALSYAKKFTPSICIDVATLTGAALRAVGHEGAVIFSNTEEHTAKIKTAANSVSERLVEFPLWKDYEEQLKSDIADLTNLGNGHAGATTAAKFLEHFVDYNWMHIDIAGPAYLPHVSGYRGKNGTGYGVRLLFNFMKNI